MTICQVCHVYRRQEVVQKEGITFHRFPIRDEDQCKRWLEFCGLERLFKLSKEELHRYFVCRRHFRVEDYMNPRSRTLLHNAVPSQVWPPQMTQASSLQNREMPHVTAALPVLAQEYFGLPEVPIPNADMPHVTAALPVLAQEYSGVPVVPIPNVDMPHVTALPPEWPKGLCGAVLEVPFNDAAANMNDNAVSIIEPVIVQEINDEAENTTDADDDFDTVREEVHKRKPEEHLEISLPKRPCVQTKNQEDPKKLDPTEKKKLRDDCKIFGEHVANKLSMYNSRIQAIVQHQIYNILFEADMGRCLHSLPEQWSASSASSPSPQEEEAELTSSPAPHSHQETSSDLQLAVPHSSSSQPYLEVVKEEEGVTEQHLPHFESLEEEMTPELGSPHRSTSHHLDTNAELHGTDNSICNDSYNKAVESHLQTICDTVGILTGNRPSLHKEDEFDIFGRSVAFQLRTLPFAIALETQQNLQSILTKMRLKTNYCESQSLRNGIPTIVTPT